MKLSIGRECQVMSRDEGNFSKSAKEPEDRASPSRHSDQPSEEQQVKEEISTTKEESKKRIHDQAERVRGIFARPSSDTPSQREQLFPSTSIPEHSNFDESIFDDTIIPAPQQDYAESYLVARQQRRSAEASDTETGQRFPADKGEYEGSKKRASPPSAVEVSSKKKAAILSPPALQRTREVLTSTQLTLSVPSPRPRLNYPPYQEITFNKNDVVCDTQEVIQESQVGNRRFFVLLDIYQNTYNNATSTVERFGIARKIFNAIREAVPPGRIIQIDTATGSCSVAREDAASRIIENALASRAGSSSFGGKKQPK